MAETPKYNVVVSERARQMLGMHIRFLAQVSPPAARKAKTAIIKAIRSLAVMPGRYPFFNEEYIPPNKYHRMFVEKWYLILYQVRDDTVFVEYIVDCRQDYGWLVR
ncbi:MAG: type II toxin-antitoxin system RelE/ParE family toxin [Planctomycetota bacterium]|jgi:plasmid stabilization system protein ParE|nr:type II toxin-antitoxin system RelE/ParE family toxin [Planctomycetota bacterium]